MKSTLLFCIAALAVLAQANPAQDVMATQDKVPGHNDATYDTVPQEEQLLKIQFLEIAPTPIITDRVFFAYLYGRIPDSKKKDLALPDEGLVNATLKVSGSVVYPDGSHDTETSVTMPLKTTAFNGLAHLTLRDAAGVQVDYMPSDRGAMLLDFQFLPMFLKSGMWTLKVDARVGDKDDTCLFAVKLTQWLDGWLR